MSLRTIINQFQFGSKSSPGVIYTALLYNDGTMSCNCPGWTRRVSEDGTRTCKHIVTVMEQGNRQKFKPMSEQSILRLSDRLRKYGAARPATAPHVPAKPSPAPKRKFDLD